MCAFFSYYQFVKSMAKKSKLTEQTMDLKMTNLSDLRSHLKLLGDCRKSDENEHFVTSSSDNLVETQ